MVDLLLAVDLGRLVRVILVYRECEGERAAFVDALVWLEDESECHDIIWVWELGFHVWGQIQFGEICDVARRSEQSWSSSPEETRKSIPFCTRS